MKKLLIISILLLFCAISFAQYTTVVTTDISSVIPTNPYNDKVRNWSGSDYALTYSYKDGGVFRAIRHYDYTLGVASPLFQVYEVPLPNQIDVIIDFRIVGQYACFCGYEKSTFGPHPTYYFGFFKMGDLVSGGTVNYRLIKVPDASFEKIEGFDDGYGFKVYATGVYRDTAGAHYALFEVINPPVATGYNYYYSTIPLDSTGHEFFDDIVILDDRIVFVGSHAFMSPLYPSIYYGPIMMRWASKTLGLSDPQLNTRYYQTAASAHPEWELNSRIQAKPIDGTHFVIGYTHTEYFPESSTIRIREFDLNLNNVVSQEFQREDKYAMYEMAYNRTTKTMALLEPYYGSSRFVFLHPETASTYNALTLFDLENEHLSLDTISSTQFIATRKKNWLFQYADQVSYNPSVTSNSCIDNDISKITIISPLNKNSDTNSLNGQSELGGLNDPQTVIQCTVNVLCKSY